MDRHTTGLAAFAFLTASMIPLIAAAQEGAEPLRPLPPPPPSDTSAPAPAPPPDSTPAPIPMIETSPTPAPVEGPTQAKEPANAPPPEHTGFQMAFRVGYMHPFGKIAGGPDNAMSDMVSGQVPLTFDVGGKIGPHVFFGGYLGVGIGGTSGSESRICDHNGLDCSATSVHLGLELQYHFTPGESSNPWIGYGIGFEESNVREEWSNNKVNLAASGWELGHFMAGIDFRTSKSFGVGPMVDLSIGRYDSTRTEQNGIRTEADIAAKTFHGWFFVGVRVVLFP